MRQNNCSYGNRIVRKFIMNLFNANFVMLTENTYVPNMCV